MKFYCIDQNDIFKSIFRRFSDGPMGRDFMMVDDDETSLHRKYGYAIMALSVVVLAVLMVRSSSSRLDSRVLEY
jgi:hypothetical protein